MLITCQKSYQPATQEKLLQSDFIHSKNVYKTKRSALLLQLHNHSIKLIETLQIIIFYKKVGVIEKSKVASRRQWGDKKIYVMNIRIYFNKFITMYQFLKTISIFVINAYTLNIINIISVYFTSILLALKIIK